MRFGLYMPNFGEFADVPAMAALAADAEAAGWDGFFVWDHVNPWGDAEIPVADPWILLAAVTGATRRIRIGTAVTPLPRRRPWVLARQTATLDRLCGGRLVFGVGLGTPAENEFEAFGEDPSQAVRARKLDEGLAVLEGLWSGEPFEHHGEFYTVARTRFLPTPLQRPRIPIWVAGTWPKSGPLRRASRFDGYFPLRLTDDGYGVVPFTSEQIVAMRTELEVLRDGRPIDMIVMGEPPEAADEGRLRELEGAGVTWFLVGLDSREKGWAELVDLVRGGPPHA
jgi:alkanesulfonate monooxygenase SsuD/methylene tetrahydromethanopterin reductase-like flavin-dependent oxidoreductase (luciferase family)